MKNPPAVALATAGAARLPALGRLPSLRDNLALIHASTIRHAGRLASVLRAGRPVADYSGFPACRLVLISAPDKAAREIVRELSTRTWADQCAVVYGTGLDSSDLGPLASRGAAVASLDYIELPGPERFIVEGDDLAVRRCRELLTGRAALVQTGKEQKPLLNAGLSFASWVSAFNAECAVECLRACGLPVRDAVALVERHAANALRAWLKAGRKSFTGALPSNEAALKQVSALIRHLPDLAEYFQQGVNAAGAGRPKHAATPITHQSAPRKTHPRRTRLPPSRASEH